PGGIGGWAVRRGRRVRTWRTPRGSRASEPHRPADPVLPLARDQRAGGARFGARSHGVAGERGWRLPTHHDQQVIAVVLERTEDLAGLAAEQRRTQDLGQILQQQQAALARGPELVREFSEREPVLAAAQRGLERLIARAQPQELEVE